MSCNCISQLGPQGPQGIPGLPGKLIIIESNTGLSNFSDFYALMPQDNPTTIRAGMSISFPNDGPTNGIITRINSSQFNLPNIGIYEINFQANISEPCQLVIVVNNIEDLSSVVGKATGASQIIGMSFIKTSISNTIISINNPIGENSVNLTPFAGGINLVSAHLIIKQIQ